MSWNTDQEPIDYLKRRVIYYKKKKAHVKGLVYDKRIVDTYGRDELEYLIKIRILEIDNLIELFENAIKILNKPKP